MKIPKTKKLRLEAVGIERFLKMYKDYEIEKVSAQILLSKKGCSSVKVNFSHPPFIDWGSPDSQLNNEEF